MILYLKNGYSFEIKICATYDKDTETLIWKAELENPMISYWDSRKEFSDSDINLLVKNMAKEIEKSLEQSSFY